MTETPEFYGVCLTFETADQIVSAARKLREAGFTHLESYSPCPVDELTEVLGHDHSRLPMCALAGGLIGGLGAYWLQYFTEVQQYPRLVADRPLNSWPAFMPITFELTVLCAAISIFSCFFLFTGLPELYHPVFNASEFARVSKDLFFLFIRTTDPRFPEQSTGNLIQSLEAKGVENVAY